MMANAGLMVQFVLLILIACSVFSWGIIFFKFGTIKRCLQHTEDFLDMFWSGKSMDFIYTEAKKHSSSSIARVFQSGYVELQRLMEKQRQKSNVTPQPSDPGRFVPPENSIENLERALRKTSRNELFKLERSLSFLATVGSTAPFIGLFGTVWGIMNAFGNIGAQGAASLAVVAPGIAEALIATAIGLGAAIPSVVGYNYYVQKIRGIRARMESFSEDFLNIVKRNFLSG